MSKLTAYRLAELATLTAPTIQASRGLSHRFFLSHDTARQIKVSQQVFCWF